MPLGFFPVGGKDLTRPNAAIWLLYVGAVSLGLGAVSLGTALLLA
jgi:hypothetical protein